jgi:hypothetical protein
MKLFKISTIALALALTGWVACSSSNNNTPDVPQIPGTGGTTTPDGPMGTGGAGGSLDAGTIPDSALDVPLPTDAVVKPIDSSGGQDAGVVPIDTPPAVDAGPNICSGLTPAACHPAIINAVTDPSVSALDPGPNPPVPYPTCAAQ